MTATSLEFPYTRADGFLLRRIGDDGEVMAHRQEDGSIGIVWWSKGRVQDVMTLRRDEAIAVGKLAEGRK